MKNGTWTTCVRCGMRVVDLHCGTDANHTLLPRKPSFWAAFENLPWVAVFAVVPLYLVGALLDQTGPHGIWSLVVLLLGWLGPIIYYYVRFFGNRWLAIADVERLVLFQIGFWPWSRFEHATADIKAFVSWTRTSYDNTQGALKE